ncbi:tyrosine-type recombinase/integrase [Azospirillum sp. TSO22-1]|uniref:tyrosine-type recombinase/integrase n=1 Tax=Azospirillum sp. TSO22-1 TaxID=716789 RepID=UPI001FFF96FD|nr:tyrosine-type recombinase/integrase [Azospirillum sp. TSO22-1]
MSAAQRAGAERGGGTHRDVHLSPVAVDLLRALPRWEGSEFVFTATGRTPISAFSDAKETLDAGIVAHLQKEAKGKGDDPETVKPLPDWRFHDLRRTAATMMAELGVPLHVVDKILNHSQGTIKGVAAIYNRHQYLEERKQALAAWADRLIQLPAEREPLKAEREL